jgi:predicted DNA-binding antitoxin AbrB/MazE fold protein
MTEVPAVFEGEVFRPLGKVELRERQRVQLRFEPVSPADVQAWLNEVEELHRKIIEKRGCFPDSTPDIAADRMREPVYEH